MSSILTSRSRVFVGVITTILIAYLVLPPLGMLVFASVRSTRDRLPFEATGLTLANYGQVFTSGTTYQLLLNTAWYAVGSVALALVLSGTFAWFLERTNLPMRRLFFVLILMPMGIPGLVLSMAWVLLANPTNGLFNAMLRAVFGLEGPGPLNIYSIPGMIVVTGIRFVPAMYLMISGVFSRLDPAFEEASSTSGVGSWATLRHISAPLLTPALFAAVIYYLVLSMEIFEVAAMLGMPQAIFVFSTAIYAATRPPSGLPDYGLASSYGMVLLLAAVALIYLYSRYVRHSDRFATVSGRGYRPRLIRLGRWWFVPVLLISGYFVLAVAAPFFILMWTSLAPRFAEIAFSSLPRLRLDAYRQLLDTPGLWTAIKNTLVIAVAAAGTTMMLVTMSSWLSVRKGMAGAWISDRLSFLVLGVPGVVLALALLFIYVSLPLPIYGTIWVIAIGFVTAGLPFGGRLMLAGFMQISRELEEASATSGAGLGRTFLHVTLPLLWPSFARGLLWLFAHGIRETTIPLMLYTVGNQTLAVTLWFLWVDQAEFAVASAIAVPMLAVSSVLTILVARQTMLREESA